MTNVMDALNLLDKAVSELAVNRTTHAQLMQAVTIIKKFIETPPPKEKTE